MTDDLAFEDALTRLERIVEDLERGEPGLSEALQKYEQGVRLLAHCHGVLDRAEQSVALLTGVDDAGNPVTVPFDATATATSGDTPAAAVRKPRKRPPAPTPDDGPEPDDGLIPF